MKQKPRVHRNLWALTVLGLLRERPMHPYEMQRVMNERNKDELLDLKPGSLYHAIGRLERAELIRAVEVSREGRRPERTVYELTESGEEEFLAWMRDLLSRPGSDGIEFLAAIGHLPHLQPDEAAACLEARAVHLEASVAALEAVIRTLSPRLGRVVLLEEDLARVLKQAELEWVCGLIDDLHRGVHHWNTEELLRNPGMIPGAPPPPSDRKEVHR